MPEIEYITTLTPKQHQALALLAEGRSITAVAKTCGLHRTTIQYWKRSNHEFADALSDAREENADLWRAASHQRAEAALALIDTVLADPKVPAGVRLKAALHILNAATAPPPHFELPRQQDPYRGANQLLAQMRADEAAKVQYFREGYEARRQANSSLFITSGNTAQEAPAATQDDSSLFITSTGAQAKHAPQPDDSSLFITSNSTAEQNGKAATSRNKPCPCKSGRKYKNCCLPKPKAA